MRLVASLVAALSCVPAAVGHAQENAETLRIDFPTALRLADERNLDVALYFERVAEASAQLAQARVLAVPTVTVGTSYNRHTGRIQDVAGQIVDIDRVSRFRGVAGGAVGAGDPSPAGIGLQIDVAEAIFRPLAARQKHTAVEASAVVNRHQVLLDVASAYLLLLQSHAEAAIAAESLQRAVDLAEVTRNYAEAGEGLLADAEMAAVQPLLWEQQQATAQERIADAEAALARLLHLDATVRLEPAEQVIPALELFSADESVAELVSRALQRRPETEQLEALVASAEYDLSAQRYSLFVPNVALNYSAGDFGGSAGSSIESTGHRDDLTFLLYWQFDNFGFGQRARADEGRARLRRLELEREKLADAIVAEVRRGYARVLSLRQQMELTAAASARAERAHTLQLERIYDQQGLPLEALQTMQMLSTAQLAELRASVEHGLAQIRLHTALGNPVESRP